MFSKRSLWYKLIALALGLVLIVLILTACGKEKGKTPAPTPTPTITQVATPTPTATPAVTPTSTSAKGPVKIGGHRTLERVEAISGIITDQIIALVEEQVKNMGGILGGREVKFVRGDDRGMVAESIAQAKKLVLDDKVTILTLGGVSAAHFTAVADIAEELKVPYVAESVIFGVAAKKYSACLYSYETVIGRIADFLTDVVKPKTVAFLLTDTSDARVLLDGAEGAVGDRDRLKAEGIDIVYEDYFPMDTADFSPYLTKVKYLNPDILVSWPHVTEQAITINKQIRELGGWGSMKYFCATEVGTAKTALNMPSAVGTYVAVLWLPGSDDPGMKAFEDAFRQKYGRPPAPELTYFYNCFWTAIKTIEMAGTDDPGKVAQALRSGNVEWDSAWGSLRISAEGSGAVTGMVALVQEGGKLVKVWPQ